MAKKLAIRPKFDENLIRLTQRSAKCNFCEEIKDECVKGCSPVSVSYPILETRSEKVICGNVSEVSVPNKISEQKRSFGKTFYKVFDFTRRLTIHNFRWAEVVSRKKLHTESVYADICTDCIKQLAKLVK